MAAQPGVPHLIGSPKFFRKEVLEMFKKRLITVIAGLALLATVLGSTGIVADELGLSVTPAAYACPQTGGGGC